VSKFIISEHMSVSNDSIRDTDVLVKLLSPAEVYIGDDSVYFTPEFMKLIEDNEGYKWCSVDIHIGELTYERCLYVVFYRAPKVKVEGS
jgi:hypothetical protein